MILTTYQLYCQLTIFQSKSV